MRLALLEALSAAADEITRELAPGTVEVRLLPAGSDGEGTSRLNLRLPEGLKAKLVISYTLALGVYRRSAPVPAAQ